VEIRIDKPYDIDRVLADIRQINRGVLVGNLASGIAAVALAVGVEALPDYTNRFVVGVLGAVGFLGVYSFIRYPRYVLQVLPDACRYDSLIILTERSVVEEFPLMRTEMGWGCFGRIVEADAVWLLYFGKRQAILVPKAGFTADADAQFREFVRRRQPS
jgi:YcxB-like protein